MVKIDPRTTDARYDFRFYQGDAAAFVAFAKRELGFALRMCTRFRDEHSRRRLSTANRRLWAARNQHSIVVARSAA